MIHKVKVTLEVTYDDEEYNHPKTWRWADLLDMKGDATEDAVLLNSEDIA